VRLDSGRSVGWLLSRLRARGQPSIFLATRFIFCSSRICRRARNCSSRSPAPRTLIYAKVVSDRAARSRLLQWERGRMKYSSCYGQYRTRTGLVVGCTLAATLWGAFFRPPSILRGGHCNVVVSVLPCIASLLRIAQPKVARAARVFQRRVDHGRLGAEFLLSHALPRYSRTSMEIVCFRTALDASRRSFAFGDDV